MSGCLTFLEFSDKKNRHNPISSTNRKFGEINHGGKL